VHEHERVPLSALAWDSGRTNSAKKLTQQNAKKCDSSVVRDRGRETLMCNANNFDFR